MTLDEYQERARGTAFYPLHMLYVSIALAGEVGELANQVKKLTRDDLPDHDWRDVLPRQQIPTDRYERIVDELGDVLWYVAAMASELGVSLTEVARRNLSKLAERHGGE